MKRLNTNNAGRMPLWQADLNWLQQAYTEPIEALLNELGMYNDYFIITGCNVRIIDDGHPVIIMTPGWFYWNGQILPVRELQKTDVGNLLDPVVRLTLVSHSNPDGARNFIHADLTTVTVTDVWQDDYLQPTVVERSATFNSGVRIGEGAWRLRDILMRHIGSCESEWCETSNQYIQYKRVGKYVTIKGVFFLMSAPVTGLPRPETYPLFIWMNPSDANHTMLINQNGELVYNNPNDNTIPLSFAFGVLNGFTYLAKNAYINYVDPNTIVDEE